MKENLKLVIMGDSIADCGRLRPAGEGGPMAMGQGYVNLLHSMALIEHSEWKLRLVNMGVNGDTSRDLCHRWQRDLLELKPDCALIMIGVNDAWRYFDCPFMEEIHVSIEEYIKNLENMEKSCRQNNIQVIFASPFYLETNTDDPMRSKVDGYRRAMQKTAGKLNCPYIDIQKVFDKILLTCPTQMLSGDRVHPNTAGQYVIAKTILQYLEDSGT